MPAYDDGITPTLVTEKPPAIAIQAGHTAQNGCGINTNDLSYTISTSTDQAIAQEFIHIADNDSPNAVVFKIRGGADTYMKHDGKVGTAGKGLLTSNELSFTVAATQDQTLLQKRSTEYVVRRLTPMECERLQGMPDDHTKVPYRGKSAEECPDGPRYKAIGNSMAVTVMRWIGEQLQAVDEILNNDSE